MSRCDPVSPDKCMMNSIHNQHEGGGLLQPVVDEGEASMGEEGAGRGGEGARELMRHTRQNVTLQCGVSYDPRVHNETKVTWNKDGDILGKELSIMNDDIRKKKAQ